jgi:hypothetical protein
VTDETRRRLEAALNDAAGLDWVAVGVKDLRSVLAALPAAPPPRICGPDGDGEHIIPPGGVCCQCGYYGCEPIDAAPPPELVACQWREDEDAQWQTACGHRFEFHSEPPHDWAKFCCYCGAEVAWHYYDEMAELNAALAEDTDGGGA